MSQDCFDKYDNQGSEVWINIALVIKSTSEVHLMESFNSRCSLTGLTLSSQMNHIVPLYVEPL